MLPVAAKIIGRSHLDALLREVRAAGMQAHLDEPAETLVRLHLSRLLALAAHIGEKWLLFLTSAHFYQTKVSLFVLPAFISAVYSSALSISLQGVRDANGPVKGPVKPSEAPRVFTRVSEN